MIGEKLLQLRKKSQLSQEEVAEKLHVSRQTISKWETDQSTPDFDKIIPLCELYKISADELLTGRITVKDQKISEDLSTRNKAKGIALGVLLYFIAVIWIMITIVMFNMNPVLSSSVFLAICGIATYVIIYTCMVYKGKKQQEVSDEPKLLKQVNMIISLVITVIYFWISFTTMAWHITWIIWIVCGLLQEVAKLIFMLKEENNEK